MPFVAKRIRTKYWKPGDDFLRITVDSVASECEDDDIIVISEKAVSVAMGQVINEGQVRPSLMAKFLARVWMRFVWGYVLGPLCHLSNKTLWRLRHYPIPEGEAHKEIALRYSGIGQALLHYSEGGIDVTNLPYALASLPLGNPEGVGLTMLRAIETASKKQVSLMIADTDKTFSRGKMHLSSRRSVLRGIRPVGLAAFIMGRMLGWNAQATPLVVCGRELSLEMALAAADAAEKVRGHGAGRTVWDMARNFHVGLTEVTWEMLDLIRHYPIVLVRKVE